jgi:hypothetical protein
MAGPGHHKCHQRRPLPTIIVSEICRLLVERSTYDIDLLLYRLVDRKIFHTHLSATNI